MDQRRKEGNNYYWEFNFGKRVSEELYDINKDPDCLNNLALDSTFIPIKTKLSQQMTEELVQQNDPRILGNGTIFDSYPPSARANFYELFMNGKKLKTGWVNDSDYEEIEILNP